MKRSIGDETGHIGRGKFQVRRHISQLRKLCMCGGIEFAISDILDFFFNILMANTVSTEGL